MAGPPSLKRPISACRPSPGTTVSGRRGCRPRNWRLAFFGLLFLSGGLTAGIVWQSARGTVTPWVVQVDHLGQSQAVAPPAPRGLSAD